MINLHFNNKKNIAENLRTLLENNAALSNIIQAVIFAIKVSLHINYVSSGNKNEFIYWIKQLAIIVDELKEFFSQYDEHVFRLLRKLKNKPEYSKFVDFYNLIIKKLTSIKNSFAFKFLAFFVRLIIQIFLYAN